MIWGKMVTVKKTVVLAMIILSLSAPAFCADATSVRIGLPAASKTSLLPVDSVIGQVVQPDSSDVHVLLHKALTAEYGFEWTETYLREDVRPSLVSLFGSWFAENLPAKEMLMSASHANSDGSVGLNVRVGSSCMSFILEGGQIVSMRALN